MNMKLLLAATALLATTATQSLAQLTPDMFQPKPYIEVSGYSEKEVVPDEIYIAITLQERTEGRDKASISEQETALKNAITALGIDLSNLTLADAGAAYTRVNWLNKQTITSKNYLLKVGSAEMVGKVFNELDRLKITGAGISRVDYSKRDQVKRELRIAALKAAKEKATYMTEAIGEDIGKPLSINESEYGGPIMYANVRLQNQSAEMDAGSGSDAIEYRKIKYSTTVNAKFEIK